MPRIRKRSSKLTSGGIKWLLNLDTYRHNINCTREGYWMSLDFGELEKMPQWHNTTTNLFGVCMWCMVFKSWQVNYSNKRLRGSTSNQFLVYMSKEHELELSNHVLLVGKSKFHWGIRSVSVPIPLFSPRDAIKLSKFNVRAVHGGLIENGSISGWQNLLDMTPRY